MVATRLWVLGAPGAALSSLQASDLLLQTVLLPGGSCLFWLCHEQHCPSPSSIPIFHPPEATQFFKVTFCHPLSGLNLTNMPNHWHDYPHLTDEKTEAQGREVGCI